MAAKKKSLTTKATLALDIAGSGIGWAFGKNRSLKKYGKYIPKASQSKGQRLYEFYAWLYSLSNKLQPEVVIIERPYRGRNSKVLASISKFIAAAEIALYHSIGLSIAEEWYIDPSTVKSCLGVRKPKTTQSAKKKHDENKEIMVERINDLYGLSLVYSPSKGKSDDDIADACALLATWWMKGKEE